VKFVHCADVHLDSPLRGLSRYEGAPVARLRPATRDAFDRLVQCAIEEKVAFVVIAGDLYDGDRDDFQTAMFLQRRLHVLREQGIPVVIAYGNHDAANEITKRLTLPDNVSVFPHDTAGQVILEAAGAVLHGRSYATRAVADDLSAGYLPPVDGALNVGVLHTSLDGRPGHDPYAPCTLEGLSRRGYSYWALGHVHEREQHLVDGVHVVFPGNLQGRDVGEAGSKGVTIVEYEGDTVTKVARRDLAPVRWERCEVDLRDAESVEQALERAVAELAELRACASTEPDDAFPAELHAVRVVLRPSASVSREWLRHPERYETQLRADAGGGGDDLWLERIELRPPPSAGGREAVSGEAVAAVQDAFALLRGSREHPGSSGGRAPGPLTSEPLVSGTEVVERWHAEIGEVVARVRRRFGRELEEALRLGAGVLDVAGYDELLAEAEELLLAELEAGA
jgi:DNA repair exonuclease SbcCD nuclease subunit